MLKNKTKTGFTLVELLVVIAIIGILSAVGVISLNNTKARARDAQRISHMKTIAQALMIYKENEGDFPDHQSGGCTPAPCGGWEDSYEDNPATDFITELDTKGYLTLPVPVDPINDLAEGYYYRYFVYPDGNQGCDGGGERFFVLAAANFETVAGLHPQSNNLVCPQRDWAAAFNFGWVETNILSNN